MIRSGVAHRTSGAGRRSWRKCGTATKGSEGCPALSPDMHGEPNSTLFRGGFAGFDMARGSACPATLPRGDRRARREQDPIIGLMPATTTTRSGGTSSPSKRTDPGCRLHFIFGMNMSRPGAWTLRPATVSQGWPKAAAVSASVLRGRRAVPAIRSVIVSQGRRVGRSHRRRVFRLRGRGRPGPRSGLGASGRTPG